MIPESNPQVESSPWLIPSTTVNSYDTSEQNDEAVWRQALATSFRDASSLLTYLRFSQPTIRNLLASDQGFATLVPLAFAQRMLPNNAQDPLLLQVLPQVQEGQKTAGFVTDPLAEQHFGAESGVLQKYAGRALVIAARHCAINCRYCFRRHFPYEQQPISSKDWQQRLTSIAEDNSITEVILSGGDPLAQTNTNLFALITAIETIPHVQRLRIHSRLPIVLPQRITQALCQRLQQSHLQVVMVVHSNHAQEFDTNVDKACLALKDANITLLNQSVLLAGINDSASTLAALSERMFKAGALPYYLHLPDAVQGTHHFYVDKLKGLALFAQLQTMLPGYLVPRLVREEPGKDNKTLFVTGAHV